MQKLSYLISFLYIIIFEINMYLTVKLLLKNYKLFIYLIYDYS